MAWHGMSQDRRTAMMLILAVSVLLRVAVALYLGDVVDAPPLLTDQRSYHALGVRLLSGHGFSFDRPWYPFYAAPNTPTAHWSFLFSLYMAAVYAVLGVHPLAARLVGAVVGGILLPLAVGRWARRLFPEREDVVLMAAACAAVYAFFALYAAALMTETYFIVAVLWSMERSAALAERPSARRGVELGLALGIATLLRQSILPWVVVLTAWLVWAGWRCGRLRQTGSALAAAVLVLALCILPFTVRNYRVFGRFLLLNSNAGYAMYSAQHPMQGTSFQEFSAWPIPRELEGLSEPELDRELMRIGIGFVLAEPGRYLRLSLSRVLDYFEFWPTAHTSLLHNVGRVGSFGLFLPFMLYGLWLALRGARRRVPSTARDAPQGGIAAATAGQARMSLATTPLGLTVLFIVFYPLLHILTWAMPRYRLPVDAVMLPFAALALLRGAELLRAARARAG